MPHNPRPLSLYSFLPIRIKRGYVYMCVCYVACSGPFWTACLNELNFTMATLSWGGLLMHTYISYVMKDGAIGEQTTVSCGVLLLLRLYKKTYPRECIAGLAAEVPMQPWWWGQLGFIYVDSKRYYLEKVTKALIMRMSETDECILKLVISLNAQLLVSLNLERYIYIYIYAFRACVKIWRLLINKNKKKQQRSKRQAINDTFSTAYVQLLKNISPTFYTETMIARSDFRSLS